MLSSFVFRNSVGVFVVPTYIKCKMAEFSGNYSRSMSIDIGGMRAPYKQKHEAFTDKDLISKEPIGQFANWFDLARRTDGILEPHAMCLATATKDGVPSARIVLMKSFGQDGFQFYSNYQSQKGQELDSNPRAALVFYWEPLRRSVRVCGTVSKVSGTISDDYFATRPRDSQIGANISHQSTPVSSREFLMAKEQEMRKKYGDNTPIPRPACWGGYLVVPDSVEFWQGQNDRIHDRLRFRKPQPCETADNIVIHKGEDGWVYERLSP